MLLVLGPVFAMGSLFDFPEEVDVSLTPVAEREAGRAVNSPPVRSLVFDPKTDLVDLRARIAPGGWSAGRVRLLDRLRAVRAGGEDGRPAQAVELVWEGQQ